MSGETAVSECLNEVNDVLVVPVGEIPIWPSRKSHRSGMALFCMHGSTKRVEVRAVVFGVTHDHRGSPSPALASDMARHQLPTIPFPTEKVTQAYQYAGLHSPNAML